jgi:hypothetical protein
MAMFTVRIAQVDALVAGRTEAANRKLAAYAIARLPRMFSHADEAELLALVGRARNTARSYAITGEQNVATFLDLTMMYGEEFHRATWAARVLQDENLDGDSRIVKLRELVAMTGIKL